KPRLSLPSRNRCFALRLTKAFLSSTASEQDSGTKATPICRRLTELPFDFFFKLDLCWNLTAAHRRMLLNGVITLVTTVVSADAFCALELLTEEFGLGCGSCCCALLPDENRSRSAITMP